MLRGNAWKLVRTASDCFWTQRNPWMVVASAMRWQSSISNTPANKSTVVVSRNKLSPIPKESLYKRLIRRMGLTEDSKQALTTNGHLMYLKVCEEIKYLEFFKVLRLEDTYYSWFIVMELHIWMLAARLMENDKEGKLVRNGMIQSMWKDTEVRSKKLEGALASARREQIQVLNQTFMAALISYDEGLLGNDRVLAGAIWRRFYRHTPPSTQEELLYQVAAIESIVLYVRQQIKQLNDLSREELIKKGNIKFSRFDDSLLRNLPL